MSEMKTILVLAIQIFFATQASSFAASTPKLALTIDDLPIHGKSYHYSRLEIARHLVSTFAAHKLPPVYGFMNGEQLVSENIEERHQVLQEWVSSGNLLGNHTYSHPDLKDVSADSYIEEIDKNETYLEQFMNGFDFKVFRYPFLSEGNTLAKRKAIRTHLSYKGYKIAQVTVDFWDFNFNAPVSRCLTKKDENGFKRIRELYVIAALDQFELSQKLAERIFGHDIPQILLLHIGLSTSLFLHDALMAYERIGTQFIDLHEAMNDDVYNIDTEIVSSRGPNFLDQMAIRKKTPYPPSLPLPTKELSAICR